MVAVQILAPGLEPVEGEYQAQGYQASCTTGGGGGGRDESATFHK